MAIDGCAVLIFVTAAHFKYRSSKNLQSLSKILMAQCNLNLAKQENIALFILS
jgi:hypothetical protein